MPPRFILFLAVCLSACNANSDSQEKTPENLTYDLKKEIPGTWEAIAFQVIINAGDSLAANDLFEVKEGNWITQLGIQPIQTQYSADHKYRSEYKNQSDSLLQLTRGIWNVFGDTLLLVAPDATYQYHVKLQGERAEFRCLLDWDGDGQEDDEYIGVQKRIQSN